MRHTFSPDLKPVRLAELRPTQMTLGMREVESRRRHLEHADESKRKGFLGGHMILTVRGPKGVYFIIDNHHLVRALQQLGVEEVYVTAELDLSQLKKRDFFHFMDARNWLHPFDAKGERRPYAEIPERIDQLADDPYRALAGFLREAGGYAKDTTPYAEFMWADFLRHHIKPERLANDDGFAEAVTKATKLARSKTANYLPGWCGVDGD